MFAIRYNIVVPWLYDLVVSHWNNFLTVCILFYAGRVSEYWRSPQMKSNGSASGVLIQMFCHKLVNVERTLKRNMRVDVQNFVQKNCQKRSDYAISWNSNVAGIRAS